MKRNKIKKKQATTNLIILFVFDLATQIFWCQRFYVEVINLIFFANFARFSKQTSFFVLLLPTLKLNCRKIRSE